MSHITIMKGAFYFFLENFKGEDQSQLLWKERNIGVTLICIVTEEFDNPENPNRIIEHMLLWRSESKTQLIFYYIFIFCFELNEFMRVLDGRLLNKGSIAGTGGQGRKQERRCAI